MAGTLLTGYSLTLNVAHQIAAGAPVSVRASQKKLVQRGRQVVEKALRSDVPHYGINTGFGAFADTRISKGDLLKAQANIIRSHAGGVGNALSIPETRLALTLRLNLLIKGHSGVRYELCQAILKFLKAGIYPVVPECGSVGASGDLIPLAHLGLGIMGEGKVHFRGKIVDAHQALRASRIKPFQFREKEGLSFVNGTEIMQAVGGLALFQALRVGRAAHEIAALTFEAMQARVSPLDARLHRARGQKGQEQVASIMRSALRGSYLMQKSLDYARVQDPYSLRCAPQIHGPVLEALQHCQSIIEREFNAVTDNPLVFPEDGTIISGGNFHGECLALAYDFAAMACSELANVSERRLELLMNPHFSKLPAFLVTDGGINSGYMALQYLSASLVNENKVLAHPASTDSIPGCGGIEDFVSMGMTAARKFKRVVDNTRQVLCAELLAACQALDLRGVKKLGSRTGRLYRTLRAQVKFLAADRVVADDLAHAAAAFDRLW